MAATTHAAPGTSPGRQLDGGRLVAGLGALALLISLFLDWYRGAGAGVSAWTSFELIDILLAALALVTLAWVIEGIRRAGRPLLPSRLGTFAGPTALILVLVSIVSEPPLLSALEPDRETGAWVALAAAALITIGALLRVARISLVVAPREPPPEGPLDAGEPRTSDTRDAETETRPLAQEPGLPPPPH